MGILGGNPKENPMHYGEVFHLWSFASKAKLALSCYQAYLNHAGDEDLKQFIRDMADQAKKEIEECDALILEQGLVPAPAFPERPEAKAEEIPAGAKFADKEIATHLAADNAMGLVACSQMMGISIREDIGALLAKYHAAKTSLGVRILQLIKEKGWLMPPPLHVKTPEPVEV